MNKSQRALNFITVIQYLMALYELLIMRQLNTGIILTVCSIALSVFIRCVKKKDSIIKSLSKQYDSIKLNEIVVEKSIMLSTTFILIELVCMVLTVIYERFFYIENNESIFMIAVFIMLWIGWPIIYTILAKMLLSLENGKSGIGVLHAIIVFFPSVLFIIYFLMNDYNLFDSELLPYIILFALPSMICSWRMRK